MHGVKASCTIRRKRYALIFCILAITLCALATSTGQLRLLWKYQFHPSARFAASLRNKPFPQQQQQQGFDMSVMLQLLRPVVQTVPGMKLSEGAGIQIRRTVCGWHGPSVTLQQSTATVNSEVTRVMTGACFSGMPLLQQRACPCS